MYLLKFNWALARLFWCWKTSVTFFYYHTHAHLELLQILKMWVTKKTNMSVHRFLADAGKCSYATLQWQMVDKGVTWTKEFCGTDTSMFCHISTSFLHLQCICGVLAFLSFWSEGASVALNPVHILQAFALHSMELCVDKRCRLL